MKKLLTEREIRHKRIISWSHQIVQGSLRRLVQEGENLIGANRVIILSAHKPFDGREKFFSLGIDAYVEKSGGLASLFEKIDYTLMS